MMITYADGLYTVKIDGCSIGQFQLYDEALEAYLELSRVALAF